jgi:hypothetical protein
MMAEIKMRYQVFPSHNGQDKGAVEPLNATFDENLKDFTIFAQRFAAKGDDKGYESWLFERAKAAGKVPGKGLLLRNASLMHSPSVAHVEVEHKLLQGT